MTAIGAGLWALVDRYYGVANIVAYIETCVLFVNGVAWGWPLIVLLVGGGLYLTLRSGGVPFLRLRHAVDVLRGKFDNPDDPGEITHLQALATALSATVGMGNIGGVAIAITQGGPGAIFWMWVTALVGMGTKFFTCTLACMYRKVDTNGISQGGPMYYIEGGLGPRFRPLAIMFSIFGVVGCLAMFQSNQLAEMLETQYETPRFVSGVLMVIGVGAVILGGIRRIARFSEKLVPLMCCLYVFAAVAILILRAPQIPGVLLMIVQDAFTGSALAGGVIGYVIIVGVKRAAFSNEAGIGTAPMAHGAAKTEEPVREGLVAMLGPLIDTLVVCTMTALVILSSPPELYKTEMDDNTLLGVSLTDQAFASGLGFVGSAVVQMSVVLFAFSTMFGYAYYGRKCLTYLVGPARGEYYNYLYLLGLLVGAISSASLVVNIIDTAFALMAYPNMIATLILAPKVIEATRTYFAKLEQA